MNIQFPAIAVGTKQTICRIKKAGNIDHRSDRGIYFPYGMFSTGFEFIW
jgi:hypothetical protein